VAPIAEVACDHASAAADADGPGAVTLVIVARDVLGCRHRGDTIVARLARARRVRRGLELAERLNPASGPGGWPWLEVARRRGSHGTSVCRLSRLPG
jgi:hypothetical protein